MPLALGILCGDAFPAPAPFGAYWIAIGVLLAGLVVCHCRHWGIAYGVTAFACLLCLGYVLASREWQQTEYAFSGEPSVYKIRVVEKPEPKERSILCRSIVLEEYVADTIRPETRRRCFCCISRKMLWRAASGGGTSCWCMPRFPHRRTMVIRMSLTMSVFYAKGVDAVLPMCLPAIGRR